MLKVRYRITRHGFSLFSTLSLHRRDPFYMEGEREREPDGLHKDDGVGSRHRTPKGFS